METESVVSERAELITPRWICVGALFCFLWSLSDRNQQTGSGCCVDSSLIRSLWTAGSATGSFWSVSVGKHFPTSGLLTLSLPCSFSENNKFGPLRSLKCVWGKYEALDCCLKDLQGRSWPRHSLEVRFSLRDNREGVVSPVFHFLSSLLLLSLEGNCPQLRYTHLDLLLFLLEPGFLLSSGTLCCFWWPTNCPDKKRVRRNNYQRPPLCFVNSCVNILRQFFSSFLYQKIILIYFFF